MNMFNRHTSPLSAYKCLLKPLTHRINTFKQEPQGALIAHLITMNTSVKSSISTQMINQKAGLPYL